MERVFEQAEWIAGGLPASRRLFDDVLARRPANALDRLQTPVFLTNQARLLANQDKTEQAIEKLREAIPLSAKRADAP